jgi:hypothetical protein
VSHGKESKSGTLSRRRTTAREWLLAFLRDSQPKFLTKAELRDAALRELKVSKNSFEYGWIEAIEQTRRYDWYEPLRPLVAQQSRGTGQKKSSIDKPRPSLSH